MAINLRWSITWRLCWSFVPQALLFLSYIITEVVTFPTCLDAATIAWVDLIVVNWVALAFSFAVFETARIPTDAKLKRADARRPYPCDFVASWHCRCLLLLSVWKRCHWRLQDRHWWACIESKKRKKERRVKFQIGKANRKTVSSSLFVLFVLILIGFQQWYDMVTFKII